MQICIFEDNNAGNFEPLSYYRPVFELVCGINTLREKILRYYPDYNHSVFCRDYLVEVMTERFPGLKINVFDDDDYLFINGSILADEDLPKQVPVSGSDDLLYLNDDKVIAAKVSRSRMKELRNAKTGNLDLSLLRGIKTQKVNIKILQYSFELISFNRDQLVKDFKYYISADKSSIDFPGVHLIEKDNILLGEGAQIKPGVVLDASDGPIIIGRNALILPNSVVEGPVYIGNSTIIKSCSTIYSNVSIGRVCKVGGELEDVVMLDYSNKQHAGFIGHAYLGSWVNLGADTNCSDLKNNYSEVRITLSGKEVKTGMQFLGLLMGDHSKSAINTMFNTGTVVGFSSNIFGAGFPDKYIPSFSWGGSEGIIEYKLEKSMETAAIVMKRRKAAFSLSEEKLFRKIFEMTGKDRLKETIKL